MKWPIGVLLVVLLLVLLAVWAERARAAVDERFEALEFKGGDGKTLLYRFVKPAGYDASGSEAHPLVVFLHGAGERGNDNRKQLVHGSDLMLGMAEKHGAFVLVPQCPSGEKWADVDWSAPTHKMPEKPSASMSLVMQLLGKLEKDFRIDAKRICVMGLSMGGYGTWDALQRYPDVFAAGVPICGGGDDSGAGQIKAAVWCFHGDRDGAVPVARSRNMVEAMKKAGGNVKYTEYPGCGHNSWNPAFAEPELLEWLFAQKLSE
jgi:predicted peptidase